MGRAAGTRSGSGRRCRGCVSGSVRLPASTTSSPIRCSGLSTRPIGRRDSEASPVMRTVMSWPAITPIISRAPVPALPKSRSPAGAASPPTPRPRTSQASPALRDRAAQRLQGLGRVQDVLALEQAGDARAAGRQRPEHERAVRDRLVAGHAHAARQGVRPVARKAAMGLRATRGAASTSGRRPLVAAAGKRPS